MLLRRTFPLPAAVSGGGDGPLALVLFPGDPTVKYNPNRIGQSVQSEFAEPSGGTPPYTYAWTKQSGSSDISNGSTGSSELSFSCSGDGSIISAFEAIWRCTVTDAALDTVQEDFTIRFVFGTEEP